MGQSKREDNEWGERRAAGRLDPDLVDPLLGLLGSAASLTGSLEARRRFIASGLAERIGADVWVWARSRKPAGGPDAVIFDVVDGGFRDETERAAFFAALYEPAISDAFNRSLDAQAKTAADEADACGRPAGDTVYLTRSVDDAMPPQSPIRQVWRTASGMDSGLISMVPLGGGSWSGLGFHRRVGRPAFGDPERCALHLVVGAVGQLHRDGADVPANSDRLFSFRPRERQVLLYLLAGDPTKRIATKLDLSPHTVADYVKVIYRRLGVKSRSELLRLFLPGLMSASGATGGVAGTRNQDDAPP